MSAPGEGRTHSCDERCAHTVNVGYVHVLTEPGGPCVERCPHPDHEMEPSGNVMPSEEFLRSLDRKDQP